MNPHIHTSASEVARLREKIENEHWAACFAMTGLADGTAKHAFITRRYHQIGDYQEQLAALIGEQASMEIVIQVLEGSPEQQKGEAHE